MAHMHMDHGMGGMSMGDGIPSPFYLQKMYWAVVGTVIGCASLVNLYNKFLYRQRMLAAFRKDPLPAKPRAALPSIMATITATGREFAWASCPFVFSKRVQWTSPNLGPVSLVVAEMILVLVLCFYKLNPQDQWKWEDIGYRTGFIAVAQLPLTVLLAGKRNIIGWLTGSSYERLNWLHRWISRILFLTVTIHMGFWFVNWARYDYIDVKLTTDPITQRGFAAWCILLWIVLSSLYPVRAFNYEFFVIQHIITFAGFFSAVYLHLPQEVKVWIWLPIGFFIFDRVLRAIATIFINASVLNPRTRHSGAFGPKATFEALSGGTTRISIKNPPFRWKAGQHVFLTCHKLAPLQAHPFTIASIPADGRLELLVKSKSGGTRKFLRHAKKLQSLPLTSDDLRQYHEQSVILEGPYGRIRPLRQFDSVFLIAGSSGATFTITLMRDIVSCWWKDKNNRSCGFAHPAFTFQGAATRFIRFIWVIKLQSQYNWFRSQLSDIAADVGQLRQQGCDVEVDMSIYVTYDDSLGSANTSMEGPKFPDFSHGKTEEMTTMQTSMKEIEKQGSDVVSMNSMSSSSRTQTDAVTSCEPNGTCCCMKTIEDEGEVPESRARCQCHCNPDDIQVVKDKPASNQLTNQSSDASSTTPTAEADTKGLQCPEIAVLSGRPQPHNLIRKMLEQASGESAVVVCGPQGLVDNVRQSVVALSDERAVHKGTGAQGIYLHTESFGY
ncbi:MAG: hypothetical protein Q9181_006683 [Wetmoreana brouardii]